MNEQIQQIAERLAGLRDALEITPEEMAKVCNLTTEQYLLLESGTVDISVTRFPDSFSRPDTPPALPVLNPTAPRRCADGYRANPPD